MRLNVNSAASPIAAAALGESKEVENRVEVHGEKDAVNDQEEDWDHWEVALTAFNFLNFENLD